MLCEKYIISRIKECITRGDEKFAIFPFGANGLLTENILRKYFGIDPLYIVDNEYYKYNKRIISLQEFEDFYQKDICVLLTIEDEDINRELYEKIKKFVLEKYIINLSDNETVMTKVDKQFDIESFLPLYIKREEKKDWVIGEKIRVRILYDDIALWNSIVSICEAFQTDQECELMVIISESRYRDRMIKSIQKKGFFFVLKELYDVSKDKPDVLILEDPFKDYKSLATDYRNNTGIIVVASIALVSYVNSVGVCEKIFSERVGKCHPDYYLVDSLLYQELQNSKILKSKVVEMGNAKFDGIYKMCKTHVEMPAGWEKMKGRKLVLWATSHGIYGGKIKHILTFDLYAKTIFAYAQKHKDIGIIFRPHTSFIDELLKNSYWTLDDLETVKRYISETDNIVWDEFEAYDLSYAMSDAIITDGYCGMICSALPTMKPIGVTYRRKSDKIMHPELVDCYYKICSETDLQHFMDKIVRAGEDEKYEMRNEAVRKYVKHFDGKNGERIRDFIKQEFYAKQVIGEQE